MKFPCEIDTTRTLKKGMKITLEIDDKHKKEVLRHLYNFEDMPLKVTFEIDSDEQQERLQRISPEQRKKIYALFGDIDAYSGQGKESIKRDLKSRFVRQSEYEPFSLSDCSFELAKDFIGYLITFCFSNGIPITDKPADYFDDIKDAMYYCLKHGVCATGCGLKGNAVKVEGGRIALCAEHEMDMVQMGWKNFKRKYHVELVKGE